MSSRISTAIENECTLLNTIKRVYIDFEYYENSPEKLQILSDKLYQTWMKSQRAITRSRDGYCIIEYLEQIISDSTMNDHFFILILNLLSKNEHFYQIVLNDHQRFRQLFNSSIRKPAYLMRYMEFLYYHCPSNLISTVGLNFYRFVVDNYFLKYLYQTARNIDWLAAFSTLIYQFYENTMRNLPATEPIFRNQKDAIDYSMYVVDTLLHYQLRIQTVKDFIHDLKLPNIIVKAIGAVWEQNPTSENSIQENQDRISPIQLRSLEYLFDAMSNQKSPRPHLSACIDHSKTRTFSAAIFSLFPRMRFEAVDSTLKTMFADGRLNGERLAMMIEYLIELIDAPVQILQHSSYDTWIIGLCMTLTTYNQHEHLVKVIDATTSFLIDHLFYLPTCDNAFQILFWFVRYDKRIQTFRLLLDRLPHLFEQLKTTNNEDLKTKLVELCHMGVAIHPEYDISNEVILKQIIHSFPQPDLNILLNHKNAHARFHSMALENEKKIKNRVGITNLGNTCYVNSVLQALYQCDLFRKYILEQRFDEQVVLRELQILFAQLNLSKRPYINAISLVKIARPAWFTINEQQDCAEFLGL